MSSPPGKSLDYSGTALFRIGIYQCALEEGAAAVHRTDRVPWLMSHHLDDVRALLGVEADKVLACQLAIKQFHIDYRLI